jgi:DNA end-binding protein Ku
MSNRALERKYRVGWRTVQKALSSAWPQPREPYAPRRSKLDPFKPVIDQMLLADLENSGHNRIGEGYYLQPSGQVAAKPYKLLRMALARSSKVAVAKYAWSGRERLGLLRVRDDVIVLHAMRWPDEIRDPAELLPDPV